MGHGALPVSHGLHDRPAGDRRRETRATRGCIIIMLTIKARQEEEARFQFYEAPVQTARSNRTMTIADAYEYITLDMAALEATHALRAIVEDVRTGRASPKQAKQYKAAHFCFATFSGTFSYRNDKCLLQHSQLMCLDFDHVGRTHLIEQCKEQLAADPCLATRLVFTSPSGDGIKWVVEIDTAKAPHERWFTALRNYALATYGLEADKQCANISRTCFLPHDSTAIMKG